MSACERCTMADKTLQCCGSYPPTGQWVPLALTEGFIRACPRLDANGLCADYDNRPLNCRDFQCSAFGIDRSRLDRFGSDGDGD